MGLALKLPSISTQREDRHQKVRQDESHISLKMIKIQLSGIQDKEKLSSRICQGGVSNGEGFMAVAFIMALEGQAGAGQDCPCVGKQHFRDMNKQYAKMLGSQADMSDGGIKEQNPSLQTFLRTSLEYPLYSYKPPLHPEE